jgi:peptide/nickel transport system permease protein
MLRFVVRRLLLVVPILFGLSILIFLWIRALPGGPAEALLGERATAQRIAEVRHRYGLDRPIIEQYWDYLKTTASGDLGQSIASRRSVVSEIKQRFPATLQLAIVALIFAIGVGMPLGFLAAKWYGSAFDHLSLVGSLIGISIPIFFLAVILKYVFSVRLGWLPSIGQISVTTELNHPTNFYLLDAVIAWRWDAFWDVGRHLILPAIALGSIPLAIIMRITRASVLDVQNEDYVRTARAKGLSPQIVDSRHVLRNAMLPIVTIIGLQTGLLLSGAVLTETVFQYPGVGYWITQAIFNRDYPVIQGGILFLAIVFVLVNLVVDVSYAFLNPRIRYGRA